MEKRKRRDSRVLSRVDIIRLITSAETIREKVMIKLLANTGARKSDIAKLKVEEIDFVNNRLIFKQKKTKKTAEPSIPDSLVQDIKMYMESERIKKGYLFPSRRNKHKSLSERQITNIFNRIAIRAGFKAGEVTPHDLKSSFITHSSAHGVSLGLILEAVGTSIETTRKHYNKPTPEQTYKEFTEKGVFFE